MTGREELLEQNPAGGKWGIDSRSLDRSDFERLGFETSAIRAIRQNCLSCSGDSYSEVTRCPVVSCALWPFRFGKTPQYAEKTAERAERARANFALSN